MNYYIGQRFGKVVIIGEEKYEKNRKYVKVKCDCGKTKYVRTDQLKKAKSCGCLNKNSYGMSSKDYEKLYGVWSNMRKDAMTLNLKDIIHTEKKVFAYAKNGRMIFILLLTGVWKMDGIQNYLLKE